MLPDPEDLSMDDLITLQCGECKEKLILEQISNVLEKCSPFPGDKNFEVPVDPRYRIEEQRFVLDVIDTVKEKNFLIYDRVQGFEAYLSWNLARWDQFSVGKWFAERCAVVRGDELYWETAHTWMMDRLWEDTITAKRKGRPESYFDDDSPDSDDNDDLDDDS
jgi:hypothetical protein